jgi:glycosyltransferase involved in cell wall biosynthesis
VKLACVVQRYGADIAGGSEGHCRQLALRLADPTTHPGRGHDVTVLTTCARDYVTWADAYPAGESRDGHVRVRRFPVARPRDRRRFADLSDEVFDGGAPPERQAEWFRENGPDSPGLIDYLATYGERYDLVLFWTYRYATTYFGLPHVADRAILLPTAEEDPAIRLDVLEAFFRMPAGFLFLTPEEEQLVSARAGRELRPAATIGIGLDPACSAPSRLLLREHGIDSDYVLYLGRVDRNKGCHTLLEYYEACATAARALPSLVLAGPATMMIPGHPRIRPLGYVPDELRDALLAHARALVMPSRYESLSIVLLEAWNRGVPAIVNGACRVLAGQVRRANGGLEYRSGAEFGAALEFLSSHEQERTAFGRQGLAYVEREYRWPTVLQRVDTLLHASAAAGR